MKFLSETSKRYSENGKLHQLLRLNASFSLTFFASTLRSLPCRPSFLLIPVGCSPELCSDSFVSVLFTFAFRTFTTDLGSKEFVHSSVLPRKEVIQPHLPIRLPCYDFTPVIGLTFDGCFLAVGSPASGAPNSHGVTGGVYKARERIHRGILIRDY